MFVISTLVIKKKQIWLVCTFFAHAQVVKRVVGHYGDRSIKPFRAVEGLEADYVHRCWSTDCHAVCGTAKWRNSQKNKLEIQSLVLLNKRTAQEAGAGELNSNKQPYCLYFFYRYFLFNPWGDRKENKLIEKD